MHERRNNFSLKSALLLATVTLSTIALAQDVKTKGLIKARSGDTLTLQADTAQNITVLLTDATDVGQFEGALKARNKKMSMASLIPGLPIQVEGSNKPSLKRRTPP